MNNIKVFVLVVINSTYKHYFSVCPAEYLSFFCQNFPLCIPKVKLCNNIDDCGDRRDESSDICKFPNLILLTFSDNYTAEAMYL